MDRRWLTGFLAAAIAVAGCGEEDRRQGGVDRGDVSIQVVVHGPAADPFWKVVEKGAKTAQDDLGVDVEYRVPQRFDPPAMRKLIDSALEEKPDGLAISVPEPKTLAPSIRKAVDAGVPVVTLNSGDRASDGLGAMAHVGQPEGEAGAAAGRRMNDAGVTRALCVNHEVGTDELDRRCAGFANGMGGRAEVLAVDLTDPRDARRRIENVLKKRPDVNGILAAAPPSADPALAAVRGSKVKLATLDLSDSVVEALRRGDLLFATDQQQYLQGYLPVQILTLNAQLGLRPAGDVETGPAFLTMDDADRVARLRSERLR